MRKNSDSRAALDRLYAAHIENYIDTIWIDQLHGDLRNT